MSTDEPLSGQQIHTLQRQWTEQLQQTVEGMGLRRRCLELAAQVCEGNPDAVVQLAQDMFDFISKPATEVVVHIDPP